MNINILISIDNYINSVGISTIISDGILASKITQINKEQLINKVKLNFFDILIVDYKKNNTIDFELINKIIKSDPNIKLFILTSLNLDSRTVKFINNNNIGLILETYSYKKIIQIINFSLQNSYVRIPLRLRKKNKNNNITDLLSDRELEIAQLLIKGETITTISDKNSLAKTTVSTYKRRIFEKIKVKNLIEMAELFSTHHNIMNRT